MKKQVRAVLVLIAAAIGMTTPSWAVFQSVGITTVTAQVTTTGTKSAAFNVRVRNVSSPLGADLGLTVNWTGIDPLALGANKWRIADQLLVVNSSVTDSNGGIKIYTDNTAADANPKFVDPTPGVPGTPNRINQDSLAAGLLKGASGTTSVKPLAMAWSVKTSSKIVELNDVNRGIGAVDPNVAPVAGYNSSVQWFNMTDVYNWDDGVDFNGDGDSNDVGDATPQALDALFVSMIRIDGAHVQKVGVFDPLTASKNAFVYLEADFTNAAALQTYKTSTLRVEGYIQ